MKIHTSDIESTSTFNDSQSMSVNMTPQAFNAILEKLYSDPLSSMVREVTTNAIEANQISRTSKKILIQVPTDIYPEMIFRDFGPGLDDKEINKYLNCLFSSTKSGDNRFPGGYGLGSKSPLAVVDSFNIVSFKNGKAYHCLWYKENKSLPTLIITQVTDTTEENGLKVIVPLKSKSEQYTNLYSKILKSIRSQLFLFKDQIDFVNSLDPQYIKNINNEIWDKTLINTLYQDQDFTLFSDTTSTSYRYYQSALNISIAVGNVIYPLPENFKKILRYYFVDTLDSLKSTQYTMILNFPIGSLEIPPNRESIMDTPENLKVVQDQYNLIFKKLDKEVLDILDTTQSNLDLNTITTELNKIKQKYRGIFTLNSSFNVRNILYENSELYTSIKKSLIRSYNHREQLVESGIEIFRSSNSKYLNAHITILLVEDCEFRKKSSFKHYMIENNLKNHDFYYIYNSDILTLEKELNTVGSKLLNLNSSTLKVILEKDVEDFYENYKKNAVKNFNIRTVQTCFTGMHLCTSPDVTVNNSYGEFKENSNSRYNNNINKKYKGSSLISFDSSYLTSKNILIVKRDSSKLPIQFVDNITKTNLSIFKDFNILWLTSGIYENVINKLKLDSSLNIFTSDNLYNFQTENLLDKNVYESEDFKHFYFQKLKIQLISNIIKGPLAFEHFAYLEFKQVVLELKNKLFTNLEQTLLNHLDDFPKDLIVKDYTKIYPTTLPPEFESVLNQVSSLLSFKILDTDKWKDYFISFYSDNIYHTQIKEKILIKNHITLKDLGDLENEN